MPKLVLFHAGCSDGFCAAWLLHKIYPDAEFVPVNYGSPPPEVRNKEVIITDFSYKRDILIGMKKNAISLIVLDHHKTAQAELAGLDFCEFDMNKSGGRMTLDYLNKNRFIFTKGAEFLVDYTEDRDLWRWQLPNSKAISAAISSFPFDFAVWDQMCLTPIVELIVAGSAILRFQQKLIDTAVNFATETIIAGHKVLCVNTTCMVSEICEKLAEGRDFGASWFRRADGKFVYSLRSRKGGIDVSEVAKSFGGGGHAAAAGFEVERLIDAANSRKTDVNDPMIQNSQSIH